MLRMTVDARCSLRVERHFDASAERVFDAWLDPATAGKWLFTAPGGSIVRAEVDARVGGKYFLVDRRDVGDIEHVGEYLEIKRPSRLVFTFAVPKYSPESTRVTVDIAPAGKGCKLTLTHEGVLPEWVSRTEEGWGMILGQLDTALQAGEDEYGVQLEPRVVRFERVLPGPIERVWAYLTESDKRGQWLGAGEMEPRVGGSLPLTFDHAKLSNKIAPTPERFKKHECNNTQNNKVLAYDPPHLLTWTFGGGGERPSEVTFELSEKGDKVLLVLTHRLLADRKTMVGVGSGWHAHLGVLADRLHGREPEPFWSKFVPLEEEYEKRIAKE
jgi:uncharacterized protein YndB with AHSA1/START domain